MTVLEIAEARRQYLALPRRKRARKPDPRIKTPLAPAPVDLRPGERVLEPYAAQALTGILRGEKPHEIAKRIGMSQIGMTLFRARQRFGATSTPHLVLILERLGYIDVDLNVSERTTP